MSVLLDIARDVDVLLRVLTEKFPTFPNVEMSPGLELEIEIRIKDYTESEMRSGINFQQFNRVQSYFESMGVEPNITDTTDYNQNIPPLFKKGVLRKQVTNQNSASEEKWYEKHSMAPIDNSDLNLRYNIGFEETVAAPDTFDPSSVRKKERYSYPYKEFFQVDLTNINDGESFELEIEVVKWNWPAERKRPYRLLPYVIEDLLKIVHDTNIVYTVNQYLDIADFFNRTLSNPADHIGRFRRKTPSHERWKLTHKPLFQPRNINARDMVSGGLAGNKNYSYNVTVKADGVRKLLVIHSSGIWLLMAPTQANLVAIPREEIWDSINPFIGTILEGELIPKANRIVGPNGFIVETTYWFMVFDCLARRSNLNVNSGDRSVQKLTHVNRLKYARDAEEPINEAYASSLLTVAIKEFEGFETATQLFDIIRKMENLKSTNYYGYTDDGYIFTPNQMPYDCRSGYTNRQTVEVYWKQEDDNHWKNSHGSTIEYRADRGTFTQSFSSPMGNRLQTSDMIWYVEQPNRWIKGNQDGRWTSTIDQIWYSSNPLAASRNELKGARKANETTNTLKFVSGGLLQTISLLEKSAKAVPIHKIPLHLRKLTKYPDICKWKPPSDLTIDFATVRHGTYLQLMVSGFNNELIPFTGDQRFPFVTDLEHQPYGPVDHDHPDTLNLVDRVTIVEYEWDYKQNLMVPRKIRQDKTRPNQLGIASAVWSDIQNPIELSTLSGKSFAFMSRYHTRIKWDLFNNAYKELDFNPTLLDIGSGRGGDVLKWKNAGRIVAVEPSADHIVELTKRINSALYQPRVSVIIENDADVDISRQLAESDRRGDQVVIIQTGGENTELITKVVDQWLGGPAQLLSMMLSMSFFWQSADMVQALANTILTNLDENGRGIFLTIDGRMVRHAFDPIQFTDPPASTSSSSGTMGGQPETYKELILDEVGAAVLRYNRDPNLGDQIGADRLYINIPDSIVVDQEEWLVYLDDLSQLLAPHLRVDSVMRADRESFMSADEYRLSIMYTGGYIVPANGARIEAEPVRKLVVGARGRGAGARMDPVACPADDEHRCPMKGEQARLGERAGRERSRSKVNDRRNMNDRTRENDRAAEDDVYVDTGDDGSVSVLSPARSPARSSQSSRSSVRPIVPLDELPTTCVKVDVLVDDQVAGLEIADYAASVVRIGTIAESSLFHALLKAFYLKYANTPIPQTRIDLVRNLRSDLAGMLDQPDPRNPGKIIHQIIVESSLQSLSKDIGRGVSLTFDTRLTSMRELISSKDSIPESLFDFVGMMMGLSFIVLADNVQQFNSAEDVPVVVVFKSDDVYQTVGLQTETGIQTVFENSSDFIQHLITA